MQKNTIQALVQLGILLSKSVNEWNSKKSDTVDSEFKEILTRTAIGNKWFVEENVIQAIKGICTMLQLQVLENFVAQYPNQTTQPKNIGIISAGNIPLVGFHDMLCVLLSGNNCIVKLAADDQVLLKYVAQLLFSTGLIPHSQIVFVERLNNIDAAIATGSNNSSRYFEYYFKKIPYIIRKNRNTIAVLSGNENTDMLKALGSDVFSYFGLGCRNVSKIYVPVEYNFNIFFESIIPYSGVMQHNKYMNNFDYNNTLLLMKNLPFLTNNFLIVRPDYSIYSPISVLHYQEYNNKEKLINHLTEIESQLQCIVTDTNNKVMQFKNANDFGSAQLPEIFDYADGVDTMKFLNKLN